MITIVYVTYCEIFCFIRLIFSKATMVAPRAAALSSTKSRRKPHVPFVNSKTPNSMVALFLSARTVSKVEDTMAVDTTEVAEGTKIAIITPTCKAPLLKKDANSLLGTFLGKLDGVNSKITSVSAAKLIVLKLLKVATEGRGDLVL